MSSSKPPKKPERRPRLEPSKPGPEADRLAIKPELIVPALKRILKQGETPSDRKRKPKGEK
ncbi:MAG: hypothetical protein IPK75_19025 [Acidobacteria bacterium]|nr:hypothetical protein [Acidobacteriota bacterium]